MTEQGDPYENALVERMNRTIKEEMLLNRGFADYNAARTEVERVIKNYNALSCNSYTAPADRPAQAHQMEGELAKKWRTSKRRQVEKRQPDRLVSVSRNEA